MIVSHRQRKYNLFLKEAGKTLDVILAIGVSILFVIISIFQLFLALGFPLGDYAMGGFYRVLPLPMRVVSVANALILLVMAVTFLTYTNVLTGFAFLPVHLLAWLFTLFLAINTLANFASKSAKEKKVMTPLSGLAFILCLAILLM